MHEVEASGNGPVDAFVRALISQLRVPHFAVQAYVEHALEAGEESKAIAYVQVERDGKTWWGAGVDTNIELAAVRAVLSALNRANIVPA